MVAAVQRAAAIDTYAHALDAVVATVHVLGRCVDGAAPVLAAHLPVELCAQVSPMAVEERSSLEVFYGLVATVEDRGCAPHDARRHARVTVGVLRERVGLRLEAVLSGLPCAYADLLDTSDDDRLWVHQRPASTAADAPVLMVPTQRSPDHDTYR